MKAQELSLANSHSADGSEPLDSADRLLDEARELVEKAGRAATERSAALSRRVASLEGNLREMEELLVRTERQAAQLANLYVATYQLHASLEAADVRAAVADIAVNLLGAQSFSIWVRDEQQRLIKAPESGSESAEPSEPECYGGGDALLDDCLVQGAPEFGPRAGSSSVAAVPFVAHGATVGVLLIRRFLPQKQGFSAEDRELLNLMAAHAASALLAADAFHVTRRKLKAYEGLLGFLRRGAP